MAFASNADRKALIDSNVAFAPQFAVRVRKNERESEFPADDFEHAYDLAMAWKLNHNAEYVEMFRIDHSNGSLFGGIGAL
jgi:hypothetical protein